MKKIPVCNLIAKMPNQHRCPAGLPKKCCCHDCELKNTCEEACMNQKNKCGQYKLGNAPINRKDRRSKSREERMEMMEEHRSGMSYKDIALKHGTTKSSVMYWIKELEAELKMEGEKDAYKKQKDY